KADLLGYVRAVFAATDAAVTAIDEARFSEEIQSGFMSKRCPVGEAYVASVGHDGRHLGEMEYIKGLQGIPGTVTVWRRASFWSVGAEPGAMTPGATPNVCVTSAT